MQFSLRSLVIATLVIGVYCGLTLGMPVAAGCVGLSIITLLLPPFIVGGIIYGRGTIRAFWIGCAACGFVPWIIAIYMSYMVCIGIVAGEIDFGDEGWYYTLSFAVCHAVVYASGFVVVLSKWLHAPPKKSVDSTATNSPLDYAVIEGRMTIPKSATDSR